MQSGKTLTSLMGNTAIPSSLGTTVTGAIVSLNTNHSQKIKYGILTGVKHNVSVDISSITTSLSASCSIFASCLDSNTNDVISVQPRSDGLTTSSLRFSIRTSGNWYSGNGIKIALLILLP